MDPTIQAQAGAVEWRTSPAPVAYEEAVAAMEARVAAIRAGAAPELVWLLEHPEDKAFILKQLKNDPQQNAFELCETVADYWSHARCAEVKEQEHP